MQIMLQLKVRKITIIDRKNDNEKVETIGYEHFFKIMDLPYEPQLGWKWEVSVTDKRLATVTAIIVGDMGSLHVHLEAAGFLSTDHEFLRYAGWEPTTPWD